MSAVKIRHLNTASPDFEAEFQRVLHWSAETDEAIEQRVAEILADVRQRGDAAVLDYTARFDGLQAETMAELELTQAELKVAFEGLPDAQRQALQAAIAARQPFLDFGFSRVNADGSMQQFRVSGEPIFSASCADVGYRGIGSEVTGQV